MFGLFGDPFFGYNPYGSYGFARNAYRMLDMLNDMMENDSSDEEEPEEQQKGKKTQKKSQPQKASTSYNKYSQIKKSYYDGGNVIEELREKTCDGTSGSVKETTTRRIGNKWCTIEEETNKNGEKTTREKWHNVPENEVDKFKAKWEKHKGSFGFEHLHALPAPKEEEKEEKKEKK
ncbi:cysteine protease [Histomonas meleagridis]|uniref:cysteine protease n=1 Tax=Histomonas meleagridis TaxID=135588 RepID=UPI003559FD55|nr:cysteine protease [Histomonas meleagridis]KAH0802865.1 cysteine protease [Histomonas meleagridis]